MQRRQRVRALWIALAGAVILSAVIVPLWVTADSGQGSFTATLYSDVIRFEADGVASLRVTIYDLAENELWNSALVMGDFVDWDRANARGERLANGLYLYLAQGWDSADVLILNKTGKVVLLPGDQVELRAAPVVGVVDDATGIGDWPVTTMGLSDTGIFKDVGIGISPPQRILHISHDHFPYTHMTNDQSGHTGTDGITLGLRDAPNAGYIRLRENWPFQIWTNDTIRLTVAASGYVGIGTSTPGRILHIHDQHFSYAHMTNSASGSSGTDGLSLGLRDAPDAGYIRLRENWPFDIYTNDLQRLRVAADGNIGIGTTNATDKLTIQGGSGNLIACYPDGSRAAGAAVFRVESDGDVYADGTAYAANFITGSADVAERINVSEWVEAGDVVEIDPEHAGFFRKASGLYSRRVAGIISTSPGVILGNDINPTTDQWDDGRPVLAIAGRVPVKASTENGPIAVGDLLVSSSVPGIAMKGDPAVSIGAVVGKAMEPLESGEGIIMSQVTLR